jgi:transcriptional regulator with XRE-family HTH domain
MHRSSVAQSAESDYPTGNGLDAGAALRLACMDGSAGTLLREWRTRRRYSQLELAVRADVSTKHLSFVETGRATPSPEMVVHLARHLDIPLRDRNEILLAAGHAPRYGTTNHEPAPDNTVHATITKILTAHTYPAIVVDANWDLVAANDAAMIFLADVAVELLEPPVNVIRLSLHAAGLAPRVVNFEEYAEHVLNRIERAHQHNQSDRLAILLSEFAHLRRPESPFPPRYGLVLPLELTTTAGTIRLFSTIATFGSPRDVTIDELAIETFYPIDPDSRDRLARLTNPVP